MDRISSFPNQGFIVKHFQDRIVENSLARVPYGTSDVATAYLVGLVSYDKLQCGWDM